MKKYDVIIIGGGVTGTSVARELSRYKLRIAVLEKEEELAFGVSKSNSGIIHPGTQNPPGSLKGRLCVEGNGLTRTIARELGVDFKEVGELIVAFDDEDVAVLRRIKKDAEALGVRGLSIVDPAWLKIHEPNLNPAVVAALSAPTAGIISPYRWVYDLAENAQRNGVDIRTGTRVAAIDPGQADCCPGRKNFRIMTDSGEYNASFVINCAGLCADEIARMVNINDFSITPRKGEEFILDKKRENLTNHLIFPLPTATSKGVLMIKTSDGNPMIGPTAQDVASKDDLSTSTAGLQKVLESARRLVPSVSEGDIISYFAGLRPVAGDDFIIRHEPSVPGMVTVAGIQSPGLTCAPAIARMVAGILRDSGLVLRKKLIFRRFRKRTNHLFAIPLSKTAQLMKKDKAYGDIVCRCEMVSAKEISEAISRGATTMDGIKFRTRAQAGRCHGSFCTTRVMKILAQGTVKKITEVSKRGPGSEVVFKDRQDD
ncbi:MAG: NAD(P)/FAD-dependent oxidoreductase [Candidatus Omnitrophota bacterium]